MQGLETLDPNVIAILKSVSGKVASATRDSLSESPKDADGCIPTHVDVELTLHVRGDVRVEADSIGAIHYGSVPWADIAALLLSKVNDETRESVIRQALAGDVSSGVKGAAKGAVKALQSATTIDRRGAVKVIDGSADVVGTLGQSITRRDARSIDDWDSDGPTLSA